MDSGARAFTELNRELAAKAQKEVIDRIQRELNVTVFPIDKDALRKAEKPLYEEFGKSIEGGMALIEKILKTP